MLCIMLIVEELLHQCTTLQLFLAHLSRRPRGSLKYRQAPLSVVVRRPSTISNNFSSETTGPIITKFRIEPPEVGGKKTCSNDVGHMTNMAAMPIFGKNLKKSSSPEPIYQLPWYVSLCMGVLPKLFKL